MITVQDYYEPTQPTLLFSLHPEPAQAIEAGTKRIEYRHRFYHQEPFQAFVHVTGTHGGIGLFLQISQPLVAAPNRLLANLTATDATAIRNYLGNVSQAVALPIRTVIAIPRLTLADLRQVDPQFTAPRAYRFLDKPAQHPLRQFLLQQPGIKKP
ncbi:hypothetical protein [Levilactobacillus brevis]|uniref:hypothetical protein n=1 Tax=Levilactobacillus brevis TaxID=1580 RepID=UPI002074597E|nr:hypothetical protein [Levilactobacillus brevis]